MKRRTIFIAVCGCSFLAGTARGQTMLYVDKDAPGPTHDGSSWCDAYTFLQDALAAAVGSGGAVTEIRVAQGVYLPDRRSVTPRGSADRGEALQLLNGVSLIGGYAGCGALDPDERDIAAYESVLSGDLGGNDVGGTDDPSRAENSFHVVTASGTDATAMLDGFAITGGNANGLYQDDHHTGGGLYNSGGSPTLVNCTIRINTARVGGGGMYNFRGSPKLTGCRFEKNTAGYGGGMRNRESSPTMDSCVFTNNTATSTSGGAILSIENNTVTLTGCAFDGNVSMSSGGAVFNNVGGTMYLTDCTFTNNTAAAAGGAIRTIHETPVTLVHCQFIGNTAHNAGGIKIDGGDATLTNCAFLANSASHVGGGVFAASNNTTLMNCIFIGNSARNGGAMYSRFNESLFINCLFSGNSAENDAGTLHNGGSSPVLINCTLSANVAGDKGGGLYNVSTNGVPSNPRLTDCILWGNTANGTPDQDAQLIYGSPVVNYNCIQGWTGSLGGTGNIGDNPLLLDADGNDDLPGTADDDLRLAPGSPCIDAGDNEALLPTVIADVVGNPRFVDILGIVDTGNGAPPIVDIGAYEHVADCNANGIDDDEDILDGTGHDCNGNGVLDECESHADCNTNSVQDICDTHSGYSDDCQPDGVPDECQIPPIDPEAPDCNENDIPDECEVDCQHNGIPDDCDINDAISTDCQADGVPDECQVPPIEPSGQDCNTNGVPDNCDLAGGTSNDCNANEIPDECEPDCNNNGIADECDIEDSSSDDCNHNTVPDECEPDCNDNDIADECDILSGSSVDDNGNGRPDECDPPNDRCEDAVAIFPGETPFSSLGALSDGPPLDYICYIFCDPWPCYIPDIWYEYVAPRTGRVDLSVVSEPGYGLSVLIHEGCNCPADATNVIACGLWGPTTFAVEAGMCYKIQVEGSYEETGSGTITLRTDFQNPCPEREPHVVYVDDDAPPGGDGENWATAFDDLQNALAIASPPSSQVTEIRVAQGTYTPEEPGGDRTATFRLPACITLTGGYAGTDAPEADERNIANYETTLSGDLNGDDPAEISDCCHTHNTSGCSVTECQTTVCAHSPSCCSSFWLHGCVDLAADLCGGLCASLGENSYHVVTAHDVDSSSVLDGFTVVGGNSDGMAPHDRGAGVHCEWAAPTIRNCRITRNRADSGGAGVHGCDGEIADCRVTDNAVVYGTGGGLEDCDGAIESCLISGNSARRGGGLYDCHGAVTACAITGNSADVAGGGISDCSAAIARCTISGNVSGNAGGGLYGCNGSVRSCLVSGNTASIEGGALSHCNADVLNCTIVGNRTMSGGWGGAIAFSDGNLRNGIFSDNTAPWSHSASPVTYSCIPPGEFPGQTNIAADPQFVIAGYWDATGAWVEGDYRLSAFSAGIDAGDPDLVPDYQEVDLDGHARLLCGRVDMGAYEFGVADYECDGDVDLGDLAAWEACMTGPNNGPYINDCEAFDFEYDGDVDLYDFAEWQRAFTGPDPE